MEASKARIGRGRERIEVGQRRQVHGWDCQTFKLGMGGDERCDGIECREGAEVCEGEVEIVDQCLSGFKLERSQAGPQRLYAVQVVLGEPHIHIFEEEGDRVHVVARAERLKQLGSRGPSGSGRRDRAIFKSDAELDRKIQERRWQRGMNEVQLLYGNVHGGLYEELVTLQVKGVQMRRASDFQEYDNVLEPDGREIEVSKSFESRGQRSSNKVRHLCEVEAEIRQVGERTKSIE